MIKNELKPEAEALPPIYTGTARFTEPFPCFVCQHTTRPPKVRATAPGMKGTRSYGGRGCCSSCYRDSAGKRKKYTPRIVKGPLQDVQTEYARHTLQTFMERRRGRLQAGSVAVVPTKDGARLQRPVPVYQQVVAA